MIRLSRNKTIAAAATVGVVLAGFVGYTILSPSPTPAPTFTPATAPQTPGQLLNLAGGWKLTLPSGSPTEIDPTALGTFSDPNWFHTTPDGAVAFRAPVNGATTSGSDYPRSELREMAPGGKPAAWSGKTPHMLTVSEAFTALPAGKPEVVGAQIHDAHNDISTFRLEGTQLWVTQGNNTHYKLATGNYVLGTRFEAKYVVNAGQIQAFYNGTLVATMSASKLKNGYFKTGAYVQANCSNSQPCSASNFGEVTIYSLNGPPAPPGPTPTPVPTPVPAGGCTIAPTEKLLDQDPTDSQSPWRRVNGERVVINFETHAVTDQSYRDDMAKGVAAWSQSPCVEPRLVDVCAPNTNCVHVVLKAVGPKGDDGNFNDDVKGGYTTGGTIEYYPAVLAKEAVDSQLNVVTHEMGHALGLRHRLGARALMNGNTLSDVFLPDAIDWHNLAVEYANQR